MQENRKNITNAIGFLRRTSRYYVYSVVCHVYNQAFSQEVFTIYKQAFLIGSLYSLQDTQIRMSTLYMKSKKETTETCLNHLL